MLEITRVLLKKLRTCFYLECDTSIKQTPQTDAVSSSELLKQALMLHPLALKKIVDRAPLKGAGWIQILKHPHFA